MKKAFKIISITMFALTALYFGLICLDYMKESVRKKGALMELEAISKQKNRE